MLILFVHALGVMWAKLGRKINNPFMACKVPTYLICYTLEGLINLLYFLSSDLIKRRWQRGSNPISLWLLMSLESSQNLMAMCLDVSSPVFADRAGQTGSLCT